MKLEDIKLDNNKLTDNQIQALYMYLSMNYEEMDSDEKKAWYYIMQKIDSEFNDIDHENTNNNSTELQ
jgi:FKBP-type peptidyl-prolyl cis-trans isomerase (trigger factor)